VNCLLVSAVEASPLTPFPLLKPLYDSILLCCL